MRNNFFQFRTLVMTFIFSAILICIPGLAFSADEGEGTTEGAVRVQNRSPERFFRRMIVEGSIANAGYDGSDAPRYSKPNGYTVGALFDLLGEEKLVLETGVVYRQFGTTVANGLGDNAYTANYISVPLSGKYYFAGQEASSFYLKAGLMGSTLISQNDVYATSTRRIGARSWETAMLAGAGVKMNFTSTTDLLLEVAYSRSIDSVFDNDTVYRSDLSAAVGVGINL